MTEVRRVTATPIEWGSFHGDYVLALTSGKCRRLLLYSSSGIAMADVHTGDDVMDISAASANGYGTIALCATRSSGRAQRGLIAMAAGCQFLFQKECVEGARPNDVVCLRDAAVVVCGTGQLLRCTRDGNAAPLWDFGTTQVRRLLRGRRPQEVLALLDDGSVVLLAANAVRRQVPHSQQQEWQGEEDQERKPLRCLIPVSETAQVTNAVWAGGSMLWLLCDDKTLYAYWFPPGNAPPVRLVEERLLFLPDQQNETEVGRVFMTSSSRTYDVHLAFQSPSVVHLAALALQPPNNSQQRHHHQQPSQQRYDEQPPQPIGWSHSEFAWAGYVHDFAFRQCAYELLVQSERGVSPLHVIALRQNDSVLRFAEAEHRPLSHRIVSAGPTQLAALRDDCESRVVSLETTASTVKDIHSTSDALAQLLETQHSLVAILHRECELNKEIPPHQSVSMQLIRRLHLVFMQLAVYQLLHRSGVGDALDIPLCEALDLEASRHAAASAQAELRAEVETEFDIPPANALTDTQAVAALRLWSPSSLCINVILASAGWSEELTLRSMVRQTPAMRPAVALLVLYFSYAATTTRTATTKNNNTNNNRNKSSACDEDSVLESTRLAFLDSFFLPAGFAHWARLAYAADHWAMDELAHSALAAHPMHCIGECPPILGLLTGVINGFTFARAYETVFHLTGPMLALTTADEMDPTAAVKLVFLAYKRGNAPMVEALYRRGRTTTWGCLATHALAWAALRSQSVRLLSGLITPQSPEEGIVEGILRRQPDGERGNVLLMEFYILMQRYSDALHVCESISSGDPVEAQRVQIIASHLRSLMPNGNPSHRLRLGLDNEEQSAAPSARALTMRRAKLLLHAEEEEAELEEAVARTTARITAQRMAEERPFEMAALGASAAREPSVHAFTPTPAAALTLASHTAPTDTPRRAGSATPSRTSTHRTTASFAAAVAGQVVSGENDTLYCEAILKRSGKTCGRSRPCQFHDRL